MKNLQLLIFFSLSPFYFLSQENNDVSILINQDTLKINKQIVVENINLFFYDIDCFSKVFNSKPYRIKDKLTNNYKFCYLDKGCYVSHSSKHKTKKSFPLEIIFCFNYNPYYIPNPKFAMFTGDFIFNGIQISDTTTFSKFNNSASKYLIKNNILEFKNGYVVFEDDNPNSKIICIKVSL